MATTLLGLPAEILLQIIESESSQPIQRYVSDDGSTLSMQHRLFASLRATCIEIDAKISSFFAARYLTKINVRLNQSGISDLEAISKHRFRGHVQTIWINVNTLFEQKFHEYTSDATDASRCSWFDSATYGDMDIQYCECTFDENVADFIADGSCGRRLRAVLPKFQNVKCFWIVIPKVHGEVVEEKLKAIRSRWAMASRVLLDVACTEMPTLQELAVKRICNWHNHPVPLPLSMIDAIAIRDPVWKNSLQKLELTLVNDLDEAAFTINVRFLVLLLPRLNHLIDLKLSLVKTPYSYFKQLATSVPPMGLKRLHLSHVTTRYKYIAAFLLSAQDTLRSVTLSHCSLRDERHFKNLLELLWQQLKLEECTLNSLNAGDHGMYFSAIHKMRPTTEEGYYHYDGFHDWIHVHNDRGWFSTLELRTADGDNMREWLMKAVEYAELGSKHALTEHLF